MQRDAFNPRPHAHAMTPQLRHDALTSVLQRAPDTLPLHLPPAIIGNDASLIPHLHLIRLDAIVPFSSGNKLYKLAGYLQAAKARGCQQLLSYGGVWSNHIHALALTAQKAGLSSIGIIRGEPTSADNPTLIDAKRAGMTLHFVNRADYRRRHDNDWLTQWQVRYPNALLIPEGGAGELGLSGFKGLAPRIRTAEGNTPAFIACAAGTGTTAAGLVHGMHAEQTLLVMPAVKDPSMPARVAELCQTEAAQSRVQWLPSHKTRFGRLDHDLVDFALRWLDATDTLLDPVYTLKLVYQLLYRARAGDFPRNANVAIVHSGGLQGWRGQLERVEQLAGERARTRIQDALRNAAGVNYPVY